MDASVADALPADAGFRDAGGDQPDTGVVMDRCNETVLFPSSGWQARYFELAPDDTFGDCVGVEDLPNDRLSRDFGEFGPVPGLVERFGGRYTATRTLTEGFHTFVVQHDDGLRIFVDGQLIYEEWTNGNVAEAVVRTGNLAAGDHNFIVEHYEDTGTARFSVDVNSGCGTVTPPTSGWAISFHPAPNGVVDRTRCYGVDMVAERELALGYGGILGPEPPIPVTDDWALIATSERNLEGHTTFTLGHDDGLTLSVDGTQIYNQTNPATSQRAFHYAQGPAVIEAVLVDRMGAGNLSLMFEQSCRLPAAAPGNRWHARYYRVVETVNPLTWNLDRGDCLGVETINDMFLEPAFTGNAPLAVSQLGINELWGAEYTGFRVFFGPFVTVDVLHDDGLRFYLDGQLWYEEWFAPRMHSNFFDVPGGPADVRVEYFQQRGAADLGLSWFQ